MPSIGSCFQIRETARFFTSEEGMQRERNVKGREEEKGEDGEGAKEGGDEGGGTHLKFGVTKLVIESSRRTIL